MSQFVRVTTWSINQWFKGELVFHTNPEVTEYQVINWLRSRADSGDFEFTSLRGKSMKVKARKVTLVQIEPLPTPTISL